MSLSLPTLPAYALPGNFLRLLEEFGAHSSAQQTSGIGQQLSPHPPATMLVADTATASQWARLLQNFALHSGDQAVGLKLGSAMQPRHLGPAGHVLIHCATLGEAVRQVVRYSRAWGDAGKSSIRRRAHQAEDVFHWAEAEAPPPVVEQLWAAATVSLARAISGRTDLVWQAHFRFSAPKDLSLYERLFGHTPRFSQPVTKLVFGAHYLDLPIAMGNVALRELAEAQAHAALSNASVWADDLAYARKLLLSALGTAQAVSISKEWLAKAMGISARTLHRKLALQQIGFRQLLEEARHQKAQHLLNDPALQLSEVAELLGYGEQSAFQHAFKRWTGLTPGQYRDRTTGAAR